MSQLAKIFLVMFEQLNILHDITRLADTEIMKALSLYYVFTDLHLRRILPGFSVGPRNLMVLLQCFRNLLTCNFCAAQKNLKKLEERNLQ